MTWQNTTQTQSTGGTAVSFSSREPGGTLMFIIHIIKHPSPNDNPKPCASQQTLGHSTLTIVHYLHDAEKCKEAATTL